MMASLRTRLARREAARSSWRGFWRRIFLHSAMLPATGAARCVFSNELKYVLPIYMVLLAADAGALFLISTSLLSLRIISCHKYCGTMACWNIVAAWQS